MAIRRTPGLLTATVLGMVAITTTNCEPQSSGERRLSPCTGIVIGAGSDDHIHIRNTTDSGFEDVQVFVGGVKTLYGKPTQVGNYRARLDRLGPNEDIDLTGELVNGEGATWQAVTMKMTSATVESTKVCQSEFIADEGGARQQLRRLQQKGGE
jgi:hypothetical protein